MCVWGWASCNLKFNLVCICVFAHFYLLTVLDFDHLGGINKTSLKPFMAMEYVTYVAINKGTADYLVVFRKLCLILWTKSLRHFLTSINESLERDKNLQNSHNLLHILFFSW